MGHVMLLEKNREVSHDDRMFLQLISGFLSISMVRKLSSDDFRFSVIENFLTSIIRNEITNPEEIESRQELFGIKLYDVLHVITIEVRDFRTSDDKKYNLLRKVRKLFDRNNVIKLNDYIVVLYDTKTFEDAFSEEMLSEFTALLEKYDCEANISYPFHDLNDFYRYYVQTVYCMDIREVMDLRDSIVKYNEVIEYHMLLTFSEQTDLDLLLNDAIKELQKADSDNDSDYTNTLFTYVNCQQNISRAAERMQLHYNTLKYRINRIISMTGIDMNDENTVFSIMISERVLKIKEYLHDHDNDIQGFFDSEWVRHSALPGSWKIK
jgi:sugar diacid utilization regulator